MECSVERRNDQRIARFVDPGRVRLELAERDGRFALGAVETPGKAKGSAGGVVSAVRKNLRHAGTLSCSGAFIGTRCRKSECAKQSRASFPSVECKPGRRET